MSEPMPGERFRLVTEQNGHEHVSSVVLARGEALAQLHTEAELHQAAGWLVAELENGAGELVLIVCRRGQTIRKLSIRRYSPHDDQPSSVGASRPWPDYDPRVDHPERYHDGPI